MFCISFFLLLFSFSIFDFDSDSCVPGMTRGVNSAGLRTDIILYGKEVTIE